MTYVFRNHTVERFFPVDYRFSGYDDFSAVPQAERYVWCYQVPIKFDTNLLADEIRSWEQRLLWIVAQIDSSRQLLVFTLATLYAPHTNLCDRRLQEAVQHFNDAAYELMATHPNVKVVDFADFLRRVQSGEWPAIRGTEAIDWKFYFLSQMPLNPRWSTAFSQWWQGLERELALVRKKCLVLDLDNTLWGGILGEDGPAGIKLDGDYPGKAFHYWQMALKQLAAEGVLLAICSKNNESDVLELWRTRSDMVLQKQDFVCWRINWQDKATNLHEIAHELNIGLDSLVFVDDNPSERELIRQQLPMVAVPEWPGQSYELLAFFEKLVYTYFRVYALTEEDYNKAAQYQQNAARKHALDQVGNMQDFLRSLGMRLTIQPANEISIPRIAQMTQKTNQFNLTTKRYTEDDIRRMLAEEYRIWTLSVSDRFGDNGITGLIILKPQEPHAVVVDSLLLSCRILGKGIEFAFVKAVLAHILPTDGTISAAYLPTEKNAQVADFWDKIGLTDNGHKQYTGRLSDIDTKIEDYYTVSF